MLGHLLLAACPSPTTNRCQRGRSCAEPIRNRCRGASQRPPRGLSVCSGWCKVAAASTALPRRKGKRGLEGRQVRSIPAATLLCGDNCLRVTAEVRHERSVPVSSLPTALPSAAEGCCRLGWKQGKSSPEEPCTGRMRSGAHPGWWGLGWAHPWAQQQSRCLGRGSLGEKPGLASPEVPEQVLAWGMGNRAFCKAPSTSKSFPCLTPAYPFCRRVGKK